MQQTIIPTLRDRKRAETRERLERAALELALRDGLDGATIDAISERAVVSPRTFFNYFDGKEDAILGIPGADAAGDTPPAIVDPLGNGDLVGEITHLLAQYLAPVLGNRELRSGRAEILRRYPQLLHRHTARLSLMSQELTAATLQLMARDTAYAGAAASTAEAEVLLTLCAGAMRTAGHEWARAQCASTANANTTHANTTHANTTHAGTGPAGADSSGVHDIQQIEERAATLTREVIRKLQ